jgi:PAS domain S-box-containing protein
MVKSDIHNPWHPEAALLEKLYDVLPVPVLIVNYELKIFYSNPRAKTLLNIPTHLDVPYLLPEQLNNNFTISFQKKIACFYRSGKNSSGKIKYVSADHPDKYFKPQFAYFDDQKKFLIVTLTDVTNEENLKNRINNIRGNIQKLYHGKIDENILFKRLNEAVMQSANTIVIANPDGNIVFANPKFEETTGYTFEEAYMKNPRILKSGDQPTSYYEILWKTISSGEVWKGEFKNKNKSGEYYWESATITPIKDAKGKIVEYLAIKEDITERKLIEEKLEKTLMEMEVSNWEYKMLNQDLQQEVERRKTVESELKLQKELLVELNENLESQVDIEVKKNREKDELMLLQSRQAAMGEMIGNIAHQWRQPLNAIGLMVYDLTDAFRFGELTLDYVDRSEKDIKSVLEHMSSTIDDFRNFFKPNKEKISFKLEDVIKTAVSFLDATLKNSDIRLITELDNNIVLFGYPSEFAQVLLNIINNAKDALTETRPQNPVIRISGINNNGMSAEVKIIDNGGGVPTTILHKIFDPYFTTKEQGKGTGVGLYMSKTIIERNMNGTIVARNTRNGVEFIITVPICTIK